MTSLELTNEIHCQYRGWSESVCGQTNRKQPLSEWAHRSGSFNGGDTPRPSQRIGAARD
jgi:hypothetical protein